jgi:hypothetical protein
MHSLREIWHTNQAKAIGRDGFAGNRTRAHGMLVFEDPFKADKKFGLI